MLENCFSHLGTDDKVFNKMVLEQAISNLGKVNWVHVSQRTLGKFFKRSKDTNIKIKKSKHNLKIVTIFFYFGKEEDFLKFKI